MMITSNRSPHLREIPHPTRWGRFCRMLAVPVLLLTLCTSCGTLIHPERRGQESGRIDPAIAILDGIGLLFFLVPGMVAFAIDFSTGAIYKPGTGRLGTDADWDVEVEFPATGSPAPFYKQPAMSDPIAPDSEENTLRTRLEDGSTVGIELAN